MRPDPKLGNNAQGERELHTHMKNKIDPEQVIIVAALIRAGNWACPGDVKLKCDSDTAEEAIDLIRACHKACDEANAKAEAQGATL